MAKWKYGGEVFEFNEDLSAEQATSKIQAILEDRRITANTTGASGNETIDESVDRTPTVPLDVKETSGRDLLGDVFVGGASGATKALQGTLELFGMYSDLKYGMGNPLIAAATQDKVKEGEMIPPVSSTPITDTVTDAFEGAREYLNLKPETLAGEIAEIGTQFVLPGIKGAGAMEKTTRLGRKKLIDIARSGKSKLTRRQKLTLVGQQAAAAGAVDFVVSTDDTQGLHDFFELGPDRSPEKVVGESAYEGVSMKLLDRMLLATEAGIGTVVLPPVLGAVFKGLSKVGANRPVQTADAMLNKAEDFLYGKGFNIPLSKLLPQRFVDMARGVTVADVVTAGAIPAARSAINAATKQILKQETRILDKVELGAMDRMLGGLFANLRYRGYLDPQAANINSLINAAVEGDVKIAERKLKNIEKKIDAYLNTPEMRQQTSITKQSLLNGFMDVLETGRRPDGLPDELYAAYRSARKVIDDLSEKLLDTGAVRALPETAAPGKMSRQQLMQVIRENIEAGGYLRQRYAAYENPAYEIAAGSTREREIFDLIRSMNGGTQDRTVFNHIKETLMDDNALKITDEQTLNTITERQMREYIRLVLQKTPSGMGKRGNFMGRVARRKLNTQLLNRRKVESPVLKEILGQTKNPTEAYISTVSDLSTFIANDSFYTRLRQIADNDMADATFRRGRYGEEFASESERLALAELRQQNPAATIADIGPKRNARYINVMDRVAERKEQLQLELDAAAAQGASEGRLRQLQQAIDNAEETVMADLRTKGYHIIGRTDPGGNMIKKDPGQAESAFGAMHNIAIPDAMWRSLSRTVVDDEYGLTNILRNVYAGMLKLKGITQFNKTILSPITQVRNFTSASLFAAAQGNVGAGASLGQSVDIVLRDLINRKLLTADYELTDQGLDYLVDLQRRGVIGSSAELREIQDNLRKGTDPRNNAVLGEHALVSDVAETGPRLSGSSLERLNRRNMFMQFMGKAADLYRAGDDVWKIYNYEFEASKLREAYTNIIENVRRNRGGMSDRDYQFRIDTATNRFKRFLGDEEAATVEEAIKNKAADNVRNLVPNYELVPQIIKDIRGMPFGNFIAFPAEIMRTGFNTLETSMKELSSDDAAIREIGMRRLMASLSTFYVAGPIIRDTAMTLAGVSEEEMESVNVLAAPYQRNATFIPMGRDENGDLVVMDYSHFNPYDMLIRPAEAILNSLDESNKLSKDGPAKFAAASWAAFKDFADPFTTESIAFGALNDVLPKGLPIVGRGGETVTGAKVYREIEPMGKKIERSLVHLLNQMGPANITPFRVPVGADFSEVELSRLPRSLFSKTEFGVSEVEPSTGRTYSAPSEIFRALSGLQTQTVDSRRVAKFKANEFKERRSQAATLFNDVVNMEFADEDAYVRGYLAANEARLRVFRDFAVQARALENLGISRNELEDILRKERLGKEEIRAIMNGRYIPYSPNEAKLEEGQEKGHEIPYGLLGILEADLKNISIDPDFPEETPADAFEATPSLGKRLQQQVPQINTDTFMMQSQPVPAPQPPVPGPQSMAPQAVTPSALNPIVNPDPRDQALAQALAARQRRIA